MRLAQGAKSHTLTHFPSPFPWVATFHWSRCNTWEHACGCLGHRGFGGDDDMKDWFILPAIGLVSIFVLVGVALILLGHRPQVEGSASISSLPTVNAFLNGTSAVLLTVGYLFIRRKKVTGHKICMVTAFGVSCLFLVSYLIHHYQVGSTSFSGQGWVRPSTSPSSSPTSSSLPSSFPWR